MIEKLISRGWIVPSKSEWTSQAFVVPKPLGADGIKKWRLVLDYRYLNSQTKDLPAATHQGPHHQAGDEPPLVDIRPRGRVSSNASASGHTTLYGFCDPPWCL
jgi:hypothetical protein